MRIAVFAFDGITMFHLSAPLLVFAEVGNLGLSEPWECTVFTETGQPIRTSEGLLISGVAGPEATQGADLVVIPSWHPDFRAASLEFLERARSWHAAGSTVAGFCLGSLPVVESGILAGREAVTHWVALEQLEQRDLAGKVSGDALYIDHGDVITSAGTAASFDACLHIVRRHLGQAAATRVARQLVLAPHREGGQAQFIQSPVEKKIEEGWEDALSATMATVQESLTREWDVAAMADRALMSKRNFSRRFLERTGLTPARWLKQERLSLARRLLEISQDSIATVAASCGFSSVVTFRQAFVKAYGTTPSSYRKRFSVGTR